MPLYRYKCQQCGQEKEEIRKVENRHPSESCNICNGEYEIVIGGFNRGFVLEPQYFEHLDTEPVWIKSKKHLKEECEKRNVEAKCLYD